MDDLVITKEKVSIKEKHTGVDIEDNDLFNTKYN